MENDGNEEGWVRLSEIEYEHQTTRQKLRIEKSNKNQGYVVVANMPNEAPSPVEDRVFATVEDADAIAKDYMDSNPDGL
jgi:hypothetical protein